ncbi:SDR family NAD(P)-dependent oxidoreductase [Mucilaginibacter sp. KACC 22063]|uniref:SDR family NAD(P)-dependent oxidoreductase n=1 Tax=Mucilaginibacter sp. KACC 22063 TaxID=3025666 RepID=UPI002365BE99|nr:SDR family NAD(P)-dependent oxidoreductase [Mucilaginibacter sp. KACC 22063]WDF55278.1 SDR family NAD(P)-dependent oxidoreductase [Mucilaginibacter sp. KACC 22063]
MQSLNFNNKWVLVTGASSGLGQEMALQLASLHKANLIITARREDRLIQLKTELEKFGVKVKVVVADLSVNDDIDRLMQESMNGQQLYAAILNAGVTYFGQHTQLSQTEFDKLLQTNVTGIVRMVNQLVAYFEQNGNEGAIMTVASMAAMFPVPYQAVYSGTKGFVLNFMMALSQELTNKNLSLTVYVPGGIATEMTAGEAFNDLKKWLMPVKQAASEGIYALQHRKNVYIPGALNRIGSRFLKLLPKSFILAQMGKNYRKSLFKDK